MKATELSIGWALQQPQPTSALSRVLTNLNSLLATTRAAAADTATHTRVWLSQPSLSFTALCATEGEVFTHGDVVKTHFVLAIVFVITGIGGAL